MIRASGEGEAGHPLLEHQHGPGPLADQQVTLPVPGLLALLDLLGPVVDGATLGDHVRRLPSPAPAPPGAPARQQLPQPLGLLPGPVVGCRPFLPTCPTRFRWQKRAKNHDNTSDVGNVTPTDGYEPIAATILGKPMAVTQPVTFSLLHKSRLARDSVMVRASEP